MLALTARHCSQLRQALLPVLATAPELQQRRWIRVFEVSCNDPVPITGSQRPTHAPVPFTDIRQAEARGEEEGAHGADDKLYETMIVQTPRPRPAPLPASTPHLHPPRPAGGDQPRLL